MMNRTIGLIMVGVSTAWLTAGAAELESDKAKLSYSVGMNIGGTLKQRSMDVDVDMLAQGIRDSLAGADTILTQQQAQEILMNYNRDAARRMTEQGQQEATAWLAANKSKEGVKTTASGLQYQVVTEGTGPKPTAADTVRVHYRGTLINGNEFDNSYTRGTPVEFAVTGVIKGWTEALQMMGVGSKWKLFIPPDLAYGPSGQQGIPPNSVLIFDIELLGIKEQAP